ncbi:lactococcin 972 family bacteriocin [Streptomyces flaveolus]|uniref:lactococcin 972 family bacteriocin n=1 Tax=Streptomyces flaveolus TaxID=67297 RepID=UPI0036FB99E4
MMHAKKVFGRALAVSAAAAALAAGALAPATPASAAAPQPKEWGVVTITVDPSSDSVTPMTVKEVGGGTWSYGTSISSTGLKLCYSNYVHPDQYHSSSAVIASATAKDYADAGAWSRASVSNGHAYTCYAYWAKY